MFYRYIVVTNKKTSMMVNNLVVFFSLFLFTSPTQGKWIFHWGSGEDFFNHRQNNEPILVHLDSDSNIGAIEKKKTCLDLKGKLNLRKMYISALNIDPLYKLLPKKEYSFNQNILHSFSRSPQFQITFICSNILSYKVNNNPGFEKTVRKTVWNFKDLNVELWLIVSNVHSNVVYFNDSFSFKSLIAFYFPTSGSWSL